MAQDRRARTRKESPPAAHSVISGGMLARLNEAGWLGIIKGVRVSVEAATQVDDPMVRLAGAASGSVKKPGQVVFAGHGEQAGGVP